MLRRERPSYFRQILPLWQKAINNWIPLPTLGQVVTGVVLFLAPVAFVFWFTGNAEQLVGAVVAKNIEWGFTLGWGLLILIPTFIKANIALYNMQAERIERFWPETLVMGVYDANQRDTIDDKGNTIQVSVLKATNGDSKRKVIELEAEIKHISQSSIENGEPMTLSGFFPDEKVIWEDGHTSISLRPGEPANFLLAYLGIDDPSRIKFGLGGYYHWRFDREAVYQFDIEFSGKLEGETDFKRCHYMNVLYANPQEKIIVFARDIRDREIKIPEPFLKVIETAELGMWHDYSSPFQRQQAQLQKEARDAAAKKKK